MEGWLYAVACVAVPCLIGGAMFAVFDAWDRRRRRAKAEDGLPMVEYLI